MNNMLVYKLKQSTTSSSNMVHERLIPHIELKRADPDSLLIAVNGTRCFACRHGYRCGWRV